MSNCGGVDYIGEFTGAVKGMLIMMALWGLLVTAVLWLAGHGDKILGYLVGTAVSAVYFLLICYRVRRSAALPTRQAVVYMRTGWLIRLSFIVLVLAWSLKVPAINFAAAVAGLLSLQIVLFLQGLFMIMKRYGKVI